MHTKEEIRKEALQIKNVLGIPDFQIQMFGIPFTSEDMVTSCFEAGHALASPAWVSVDERLPEAGDWLVTVQTDEGREVHSLYLTSKGEWEHEGEPTYCHSYYFKPIYWAPMPSPAAL